ncbi:serine/threonine protein kinase [Fonticula alba]|uniref:Serine/threonine protein kinase n=1 Tax=Fonticula alba TaxID=691883 RepID=A0A058Z1J1_FONAL|nr:serine/threonine protein kinase [Fonticula alba]KCV68130.1 serine/threonine protein kinase [Fonticula alba]|eukprot:XP_009497504.1 serine/threonine protein kinase [Fonticula alba]
MPAWEHAATELSVPSALQDPGAGGLACVAESWLAAGPAGGLGLLPADTPADRLAENLLGFPADGSPVVWLRPGGPGAGPLLRGPLPGAGAELFAGAGPVRAVAALPPFGRPGQGHLFACASAAGVWHARVECTEAPGAGAGAACPARVAGPAARGPGSGPCDRLRPVSPRAVAAAGPDGLVLYHLLADGQVAGARGPARPAAVLTPLAMHLSGDARVAGPGPGPGPGVFMRRPGAAGGGPAGTVLLLPGTPGPGLVLTGGPGPHRRTSALPGVGQVLGGLPPGLAVPAAEVAFHAVALGPGLAMRPAAVVLLAGPLVGVSVVFCPGTGGCWLQPALFGQLPGAGAGWSAVFAAPSAAAGPGAAALRVALPGAGAPVTVVLEARACASTSTGSPGQVGFRPATYGPLCAPCDGLCRECAAAGPGGCTGCRLHLPGRATACAGECPAGLAPSGPDSTGECRCLGTCRTCEPAQASEPFGPYRCTACAAGHALPVNAGLHPGACQPCAGSCAECAQPGDPLACTACPRAGPAAGLLHRGACVGACPAGTWPDGLAGACRDCPANCAQCSGPGGQCDRCLDRHFPGPGPDGGCHPCDGSCAACAGADACTECRPGLSFLAAESGQAGLCTALCPGGQYEQAGQCVDCHAACQLCAGAGPDRCEACAAGHRWGPAGPAAVGSCVPCPAGCDQCLTDGRCVGCTGGLLLTDAGACVATCPAGTWPDTTAAQACAPCAGSCAACAGGPGADRCTACPPGWELLPVPGAEPGPPEAGGHGCYSGCPPGEYRLRLEDPCGPCAAGCLTCTGPAMGDCWRCADAGLVLQGAACVAACDPGFASVEGRCIACHGSCQGCVGSRSTECRGCAAGLLPAVAGQATGRCLDSCPAGWRATPAGCVPCPEQCAACGAPDSGACTRCQRGWLLHAGGCVADCPEGTTNFGGLCAACHGSCRTCFGPGPDQCATCRAHAPLQVGSSCWAACPAGMHLLAADRPPGDQCARCAGTCGTCSGPGADQCTGCPAGRVPFAGACLLACPEGFYPAPGPAADGPATCEPCASSCTICTGPSAGQCGSCPAGSWLHQVTCVEACPGGTFACFGTRACAPCGPGCLACERLPAAGAACQPRCLACRAGLFLTSAEHGATCEAACPPDMTAPAPGRGNVCLPCAGQCRGCIDTPGACKLCALSYMLMDYDGGRSCGAFCPQDGTPYQHALGLVPGMGMVGACLHCPAGCDVCDAPTRLPACRVDAHTAALLCDPATECNRCRPGLRLLTRAPGETACVDACPAGHHPGRGLAGVPVCLPCPAACVAGCGPTGLCPGPGPGSDSSSGGGGDSHGGHVPGARHGVLALGLGVGLGLLFLLVLGLVVFFLVWRPGRRAARTNKAADLDADASATVLNTIMELSLPGHIHLGLDHFAPLPEETLGAGTQAAVFAARCVGAGTADRLGCPPVVAVKRLKADRLTATQATLFQNEIALMWMLREHPNVVRLYGYSEQPPAIVMERFQTDLGTLLHSAVPLDLPALVDLCHQWIAGLEAMHTNGVAHCDLKPGNVFVSQAGPAWRAAIGDLGASRNLSNRSSALVAGVPELNALTARYAAPEIFDAMTRRRPLDRALLLPADIFSAGIMLWECLSRQLPWKGFKFASISSSVGAGIRPDLSLVLASERAATPPTANPGPAMDAIQAAWVQDPHARPVASHFRALCVDLM